MNRDFRWSRARRRVLLALLSDAANLDGFTIARLAQVTVASVYPALDYLEGIGFVTSAWEDPDGPHPRRRLYRLTPDGRLMTMGVLDLRANVEHEEI